MDHEGVPIFNTVSEAVSETKANTSMVFVPARFAADAVLESFEAGIDTIVAITEHIRKLRSGEPAPFVHHRMECSLMTRASTAAPSEK